MGREKTLVFLRKYTMVIVLILVTLFFTWKTGGRMLLPQNVNNLIAQNAYVFILATGMLLCILTGGNIDLSVGSIVCFVGAIGATFMVNKGFNVYVSIIIMLNHVAHSKIRRRRISYGKREDFSIFEKIYDGYCADSGNFVFYMENRGKNVTSTEC